MVFEFGPFELDLAGCELRRDGRSIPLQPRVFATLRYLLEHRDRVIAKQELIDALWDGHQLNAVAVPWTINRARKALGQRADERRLIETIRGHGYRFVGQVRQVASDSAPVFDRASSRSPQSDAPQCRSGEPFVGRDQIMQQLMQALDAAGEGCGSLHLLTGEAGIGKTRCVSEFAVMARRRGLQVWLGRCFERGVAPAFWPFIQILRAACSDPSLNEALRKDGARLLEELEPRVADAPTTPDDGLPWDDARFWLLDRLSRWLCRTAKAHIRVVELDDLDNADESSLRAIALLAPLLAQSNMLVIATARDAGGHEVEHPAPRLSTRFRPCEHIALSGLRMEDVEMFLAAALGEDLAVQLSQALYTRTAGNPLFVREVTRVVRAQYDRDGSIRAQDVQLPEAAKELISARFHSLDAQSRALLDAACVIGEELEVPVLQRATGMSPEAVLSSLQAAVSANILEPKRDGLKHAFVHPLMREVLYAALPTARRAHLHATVGLAFEAVALIEPKLNQLAYHFHHAPIEPYYELAARYGRLAGDAAMRVLAYDEAVQFYGWALEAQPHLSPPNIGDACGLLLASAAALLRAGRRREWRAQCERAIELARQAKLPEIMVQGARLLRPSISFARMPDLVAVSALEEALTLLPDTAVVTRAHAYSQLASLPPYSWRIELSKTMSDEAVRLASGSSDTALLLEAHRARLYSLSGPDWTEESLRVSDEILKLDPRTASAWSGDAHLARYEALFRRGDMVAADRALDAFGRLARELRARPILWHYDRLRAQRVLHAGRLDEAERLFNELWAESRRIHVPFAPQCYRAQVCALNLERTGKRLSSAVTDSVETSKWVQELPARRAHLILIAIETGENSVASRDLRSLAEHEFAAVTSDATYLFSLCQLALAAVALQEHGPALQLVALLKPHAELTALSTFTLSIGCVSGYLAVLERFLGRRQQAREYFEAAVEVNARTGHELQRLRACLGLSELLAEGGSREDRIRAADLVAEVSVTAERYGAHALHAAAVDMDVGSGIRNEVPVALASDRVRRSSRPAKSSRGRVAR